MKTYKQTINGKKAKSFKLFTILVAVATVLTLGLIGHYTEPEAPTMILMAFVALVGFMSTAIFFGGWQTYRKEAAKELFSNRFGIPKETRDLEKFPLSEEEIEARYDEMSASAFEQSQSEELLSPEEVLDQLNPLKRPQTRLKRA